MNQSKKTKIARFLYRYHLPLIFFLMSIPSFYFFAPNEDIHFFGLYLILDIVICVLSVFFFHQETPNLELKKLAFYIIKRSLF